MIKNFDAKKAKDENSFVNQKRSDLAVELSKLQRKCIEANIPVLIIVDGWESAGKGYVINHLVRELDTKYFKVGVFGEDEFGKDEHPYGWYFWRRIPAKGEFAIFDRSSYFRMFNDLGMKKSDLQRAIGHFDKVEKMLRDDGMLILKYFLTISEKTQRDRINQLMKDKNREFLISKHDRNQNDHYAEYEDHFDNILEMSNFSHAPWMIVSSENPKNASKQILGLTNEKIAAELALVAQSKDEETQFTRTYDKKPDYLQKLIPTLKLSDKKYDAQIDDLQEEASNLLFELYTKRIPSILVFEGVDAAGKGGAIQRLTKLMDPRLYEVNPTSAPSDPEKEHHYLWRFYNNFPSKGNMAIFDRSWYGRVMVERVEGFAKPAEWERAYDEINELEKELTDNNALLMKFFLFIDQDEQLKRFEVRKEEKPYKLTDEDWRNREKWDLYVEAMNEMIDRTSPKTAPWVLVEGNDKKYARVKVLQEFIVRTKSKLKG